jgi:hypothetical protein
VLRVRAEVFVIESTSSLVPIARARPLHAELVTRLNVQSVRKHFDAYEDVDWESPELRIELDDPRFERPSDHGLGKTDWYRSQPPPTRARLGLHIAMEQMRIGMDFESILSRGLLELASTLEPGSPELRYAYHEVIEEAQHSLMFQEMIARTGLRTRGLEGFELRQSRKVPALARTFPELFFVNVLGGEAPIDHLQRLELRRESIHPLLHRILQLHVTEEARHVSFAKSMLRERVPRLSRRKLLHLRIATPLTLAAMAHQMLVPPRWLFRLYGVPDEVRLAAYRDDAEHRRRTIDGVRPIRELCVELGLVTPFFSKLWKACGIWEAPAPSLPRAS